MVSLARSCKILFMPLDIMSIGSAVLLSMSGVNSASMVTRREISTPITFTDDMGSAKLDSSIEAAAKNSPAMRTLFSCIVRENLRLSSFVTLKKSSNVSCETWLLILVLVTCAVSL